MLSGVTPVTAQRRTGFTMMAHPVPMAHPPRLHDQP
jgi:hypothetical protein